jgi:hypothetical protein
VKKQYAYVLVLTSLLLAASRPAQAQQSWTDKVESRLLSLYATLYASELTEQGLVRQVSLSGKLRSKYPAVRGLSSYVQAGKTGDAPKADVFIEFEGDPQGDFSAAYEAVEQQGGEIQVKIGAIVTAEVPLNRLPQVAALEAVKDIETGKPVEINSSKPADADGKSSPLGG